MDLFSADNYISQHHAGTLRVARLVRTEFKEFQPNIHPGKMEDQRLPEQA